MSIQEAEDRARDTEIARAQAEERMRQLEVRAGTSSEVEATFLDIPLPAAVFSYFSGGYPETFQIPTCPRVIWGTDLLPTYPEALLTSQVHIYFYYQS